ncbi:MAG: WecB/TagA/CpsF family glycosyltransferase [Anaerolinea sp.]|nr:WecB/TagA/CpsF family glycosyltransferase [Anaerolinea sp.]
MRLDLLGIPTTAQTFSEALSTLKGWSLEPGRRYVCTCPVYTLMRAREDAALRDALIGADMVTADGMPIVWLQRQQGAPTAQRVYGPDLMLSLCESTAAEGVRHYFWGGRPTRPQSVAERVSESLRRRFPLLEVAGAYSSPIQPLEAQPDPAVIERINQSDSGVVWVGLGSPKQDVWMRLYRPFLNAPLLIGVGAAFDLIAGIRQQAPRWMQHRGLEWLFRLTQEPRRLWRRYLIYNPRFMLLLLRERYARPK